MWQLSILYIDVYKRQTCWLPNTRTRNPEEQEIRQTIMIGPEGSCHRNATVTAQLTCCGDFFTDLYSDSETVTKIS